MNDSAYREQMDALHVPEEKAEETLRLMLEENRRLNQKKAAGRACRRKTVWICAAAAAAACLLMVWIQAGQSRGPGAFASVKIAALPAAAIARGEDAQAVSFREAFGLDAADLFPGWTTAEENASARMQNGETVHEARLTLKKGETLLSAEVTDYEPSLLTVLKKDAKPLPNGVYLAKDADSGALYGVRESGELFVIWSSTAMTEKEFRQLFEGEQTR